VVVNAASIEPDRMEEVLFGRESGDAPIQLGVFERAHGGTLFIDEVGDMPLGTQSKILRVLVDQAFSRLGGSSTVRVDVTIGVQKPEKVDTNAVKAALPVGDVSVKAVKGGLDVPDDEGGDIAVIASAGIEVYLDVP